MKARRTLPVLAALMLIAAVVVLALRFGWFDTATAPVILPDTTALPTASGGGEGSAGLTLAEVTPETVQAVVRTLARPDSYSRRMLVNSYWEGGSQNWQIQVWQKNGVTRIRIGSSQAGTPDRNLLLEDGSLSIWYGDGPEVFQTEASQPMAEDALQMIPTYEDLLALDPAQIEDAGYVNLYGTWRIMAAVREKPTDYLMTYYISIETGLLEAAERRDGDRLIYRMTSEQADLAAPDDEVFLLPGEENPEGSTSS
jgi:hypothetical protein